MEFLIAFIGEFLGNMIFETLIWGIEIVFMQPKNKLLHKRFILLKTINPKITKGMRGIVLKVRNSKEVYVYCINRYGKKRAYQKRVYYTILIKNTNLIQVN